MIENHKLNPFGHDNKLWDIFFFWYFIWFFFFVFYLFFIIENISILWQQRFSRNSFYCFVHILHMKGLFDCKKRTDKTNLKGMNRNGEWIEEFVTSNVIPCDDFFFRWEKTNGNNLISKMVFQRMAFPILVFSNITC